MKKIEIRYPNDPKAQKQWELICRGFESAEKERKRFIKQFEAGKIKKTIFNQAQYLCYTRN